MRQRLAALRRPLAVGVLLVAVLLAVAVYALVEVNSDKTAVAYFQTAKNIYPKDRVRIVGVDVGEITDIEPEPDRVKVTFSYDGEYTLARDVHAVVMSPTLVSTRFLQVGPLSQGDGPALPDGGVIPVERTRSPLEFDDLKDQVTNLARSLGPTAQDRKGSLSRFLEVAAANGMGGNGARFNRGIHDAANALQTLADGREDFFGTIRNLQVFVTGLAQVDGRVVEFNRRLADVSGMLADNDAELKRALEAVERASGQIERFAATNKGPLTTTVSRTGEVLQSLAAKRDVLAQVLHVGPSTLLNFFHIYNPQTAAFHGTLVADNLNTPADLVCTGIANATGDPAQAQQQCGQVLGPTLNMLRTQNPPIGVNPLTQAGAPVPVPGWSGPEPKSVPGSGPNAPNNGSDGAERGNG